MAAVPVSPGQQVPSAMGRSEFVECFGGVFEQSPWIAEATFDRGAGPELDSVEGLHLAMVSVFRAADSDRRLQVLRAHPDLAGKLAAAKRLTQESTIEQASAGLDALTDEEGTLFSSLNAAYTGKHGFPFIIAVREHDKHGILAEFQRRLGNTTAAEFQEACLQVERIAALRLKAIGIWDRAP